MPQSDSAAGALRAAVESEVAALEALCGTLERALMRREWDDLAAGIADSRRITHALANAMEDSREVRDPSFDEGILRRLRYIHAIRQNQMSRLQQYHDAVGERLQLVARWKSAVRSFGKRRATSRLASLDHLS